MNFDRKVQDFLKSRLTLEDAFPTRMPKYVNSFGYFFGTMTLSSLMVIIASGVMMTIFGPVWSKVSSLGAFVNAMHFWAVEIFYVSAVMHILFKFFTAAWRGGRWRTWVIGWLTFVTTIFSGISGTLLQQSWDAQWNAQQGKDAFAALGLGWLNWLDLTSVLSMHVGLFAILVILLTVAHLFSVRSESPVHPIVDGGDKVVADSEET